MGLFFLYSIQRLPLPLLPPHQNYFFYQERPSSKMRRMHNLSTHTCASLFVERLFTMASLD